MLGKVSSSCWARSTDRSPLPYAKLWLGQEIVSKVPSLATRRDHLTQSVAGTFAPYPKIRAKGQMTQLETFANRGIPSPTEPPRGNLA